MIKAILFDLGNTIVDHHASAMKDEELDLIGLWNIKKYLANKNIEVTMEALYNKFYFRWISMFPTRKDSETEIDAYKLFINLLSVSREEFEEIMLEFHEPSARMAKQIGGIDSCLPKLKAAKFQIGLISNTPLPGKCNDLTLSKLGLLKYLDCRLYSYDFGIRKPHCEIFIKAAEKLECDIAECLMIGDSLEADIKPAQQIGMKVIWFNKQHKQGHTEIPNIMDYSNLLNTIELI